MYNGKALFVVSSMETKPMRWFLVSNESESEIIESREFPKMRYEGGKWTSSSGWCSSLEELKEKNGIPDEPCRCCGRIFSTHFEKETKANLIRKNVCFTCNFWQEYVEERDTPRYARIGGCHYAVGPENNDHPSFRGFGGRRSKIRWNDGREVVTTNLWFQGQIPERFRAELPDNAVFVSE